MANLGRPGVCVGDAKGASYDRFLRLGSATTLLPAIG